jgi:hypothetical protein
MRLNLRGVGNAWGKGSNADGGLSLVRRMCQASSHKTMQNNPCAGGVGSVIFF